MGAILNAQISCPLGCPEISVFLLLEWEVRFKDNICPTSYLPQTVFMLLFETGRTPDIHFISMSTKQKFQSGWSHLLPEESKTFGMWLSPGLKVTGLTTRPWLWDFWSSFVVLWDLGLLGPIGLLELLKKRTSSYSHKVWDIVCAEVKWNQWNSTSSPGMLPNRIVPAG